MNDNIRRITDISDIANICTDSDISHDKDAEVRLGKILKNIMVDHEISNIDLESFSGLDRSYVSRLRNGKLSQLNYIRIIRGLPEKARREYVEKVFFGELDI